MCSALEDLCKFLNHQFDKYGSGWGGLSVLLQLFPVCERAFLGEIMSVALNWTRALAEPSAFISFGEEQTHSFFFCFFNERVYLESHRGRRSEP